MLRVMTWNIRDGGHGREAQLAALIQHHRPDVLVLQEVRRTDWLETLARDSGMSCKVACGNTFWKLACLSRYPILAWHSHHPFPPVQRTILEAEILCSGGERLRVFSVHLVPWPGLFTEAWRCWELGVLLRRARACEHQPALVVGDFNALAPEGRGGFRGLSPVTGLVLLMQGGLNPRWAIQRMRAAGWVDGFRALHPDAAGYTFPVPKPTLRLDYVWVNRALRPALRACAPVQTPAGLVNAASDHYPLMAAFAL